MASTRPSTSFLTQHYDVSRRLGASELAEVFVARQASSIGIVREVVLKRFSLRLSQEGRGSTFVEEALVAAGLSHSGIAHVHDVGEEGGRYYVVREHRRGLTLRQLVEALQRQGRMVPMEMSLTIVVQILEALSYAHGYRDESGRPLNVVHRALGPDNVLVTTEGQALLLDFGTAWPERFLRDGSRRTPRHFAYIAPECYRGDSADAAADIFSVGVLLYELTVGQRLFGRPTVAALAESEQPVPPPTFARAGYPADLENVVMRALEAEPNDRHASVDAMLEQVEELACDTGLRLSRSRLGRLVAESFGQAPEDHPLAVEDTESEDLERSLLGAEELDFDRTGLFDGASVEGGRALDADEDELDLELEEAPTASVVKVAEPPAEPAGEIAQVQQRSPEIEVEPVAQGTTPDTVLTRRRESTVVVTDELVEEELDLGSAQAELLLQPPISAAGGSSQPRSSDGDARERGRVRTSSYLRAALDDFDRAAGGAPRPGVADPGDPLVSAERDAGADEGEELPTQVLGSPVGLARRNAADIPSRPGPPDTSGAPLSDIPSARAGCQSRAEVVDLVAPAEPVVVSALRHAGGVDDLEAADAIDRSPDDLERADHEPQMASTEVAEVLEALRADIGISAPSEAEQEVASVLASLRESPEPGHASAGEGGEEVVDVEDIEENEDDEEGAGGEIPRGAAGESAAEESAAADDGADDGAGDKSAVEESAAADDGADDGADHDSADHDGADHDSADHDSADHEDGDEGDGVLIGDDVLELDDDDIDLDEQELASGPAPPPVPAAEADSGRRTPRN